MARPKAFDPDTALDTAIAVFGAGGFAGTTADDLVRALKIGRQSLYDTFGDKRGLYLAALKRYVAGETAAHIEALKGADRARDGIAAMLARVVATAHVPCLGTQSVCEFGTGDPELEAIHHSAQSRLSHALSATVAEAQRQGEVPRDLDPAAVAAFLQGCILSLRMAGRGGAGRPTLDAMAQLALRSLN